MRQSLTTHDYNYGLKVTLSCFRWLLLKVSVLISVRLQDCIRRDRVRNECPLGFEAWLAEMPMLLFSSSLVTMDRCLWLFHLAYPHEHMITIAQGELTGAQMAHHFSSPSQLENKWQFNISCEQDKLWCNCRQCSLLHFTV